MGAHLYSDRRSQLVEGLEVAQREKPYSLVSINLWTTALPVEHPTGAMMRPTCHSLQNCVRQAPVNCGPQ